MKITGNTTLQDLQNYIRQICTERGFDDDDLSSKMVMLTEEVGELAKSIRKLVGLKIDIATSSKAVEEEMADVVIVLLGMANALDIDIAKAIEFKEVINRTRNWK